MGFHKAQLEAIRHFNGPCITLAGPGSGKTTVLTYRILNLIEKCGVAPEHILVITFTRAAATEMKERFLKLSDNRYSGVCFQTFHSFFFMILRKAYGYRADNIITQQEQTRFFKNILNEYELEITDTMELIRHATMWISNVKRSGKSPDTQPVAAAGICPQEILCEIYHKYQQYLTAKRLIDFEDMTVYCYELFSQRKDILRQWQEQYQYILVDEFQDIDAQQFQTLQLLADRYRNLFIVGDDDQSIYGFRGACPDYMQDFKKIYPEAVQINLCVNYRCGSPIVAAAKSVIAHNKNRYEKDIVAVQTGYGMQTACVVVKEFESTEKQNQFLAEQILKHSKQGKFSDIAVLVRTNTGAQDFLQTFLQYKIPFTIKEHFLNPFEHWIAQDILAYIHLAMGSRERKYFFRIINRPVRYLSREAFADTVVDFERAKAFYAEKSALKDRVEQLEGDILILSKFSPFAAVNYIRKAIGYEDYIRQYADEKKQDKASLYEILDEISQSTKTCRTFPEWFEYIKAYTEQLQNKKMNTANAADIRAGGNSTGTAITGMAGSGGNSMDSVTVSTMHASKGLEYKKVFLVGLNEGNVPYHKAVLEKELEEERRMFYVAMTRAKEELHLYFPRERAGKAQKISRFLQEIDRSSAVWELIEDK